MEQCDECGKKAKYHLMTQFTGDHKLCGEHAMRCGDFMVDNPPYTYWEEIPDPIPVISHGALRSPHNGK